MIKSIALNNFKCYRHQAFNLSNLTVFCGGNSVGKSTAIQALAMPFQSKFEKNCQLNGELINLGNYKDIFSSFAETENNKEELKIDIALSFENTDATISFGYRSYDEQKLLGNYLKLVLDNTSSEFLNKWYFEDFGFQFLEAERLGPRNNFSLNQNNMMSNWVGCRGEYSIEVIEKLLNKGYYAFPKEGVRDPRMPENLEIYTLVHTIEAWMSEITPGFSIEPSVIESAGISHASFKANGTEKATKPINMGFGLSYVLGIVTALIVTKPSGLVVIENPEAHLHPRGQSYLGRLIALSALAGVQVIIETHSDHLLNGIRVIACLNQEYEKDMFKVFYISAGEKNTEVKEISIGNKGELSSWPPGFFDQQAFDVRTLMKGIETTRLGE